MDIIILISCILVNLVPAFFPISTWNILAVAYNLQGYNIVHIVFLGVLGSTIGRYLLAKGFYQFVNNTNITRLKDNLDFMESKLSGSTRNIFLFSFVYFILPTPSNILFIPAGKSNDILYPVILGHIFGRAINYTYLIILSSTWLKQVVENPFSVLSIILNVSLLIIMCVDWQKLFVEKKIEFIFQK